MEPVVHLRGAVTLLGRFPALAGVDLDVAAGEIVLLRGPNGAGKTTLLRLCAGLLPVAAGEAHGARPRPRPTAARRARCAAASACSGHATGLYDELTVADNVRFWGRAAGAGAADVDAALAACGLDGAWPTCWSPACRPVSAAARRSRASWPAAPSSGCSTSPTPASTRTAATSLDGLVAQAVAAGATVLLSSHELDRAEALADASSRSSAAPPTPAGRRPPARGARSLFRDAALMAGKDLRIELRSQVTTQQVAPFAVLVLILFGFALDPDRGILARATPGLFWVAVLFCALLAIQRAFTIEAADGGRDALRLSGLDPAGIFLGKAAAIAVQLARSSRWCWPSASSSSTAPRSPVCRCCSPPAWPRPRARLPLARCTACSPPASASARRCSRSCCCRCSRRC